MSLELGVFGKNDGSVIADIHLSTEIPFMKYQFGKTSPDVVHNFLTNNYADNLAQTKKGKWQGNITHAKVVDRVDGKETPIAWAEWEEFKYKLEDPYSSEGAPPTFNHKFLAAVDFSSQRMYEKFLKGKKCYMLCQLFTLPKHGGRGAARMLLGSLLDAADKEGAICFLEVDGDSWQRKWYETKWHFKEVDKCEIDLEACDLGKGVYRHVAMIRKVGGVE